MHNERKVFGRICPNRLGNCHSRTEDKKPATHCGKQGSAKNAKNNVPVPIYIEEHISIVDEAFATIAWEDLADCTSVLRREGDSTDHQMHVSGFEIQDFVDSTVSFIPESPSLLDCSACSSGSLPLSDCSLSEFSGCSVLPVSSLLDTPPRGSLSPAPPVPPQAQTQAPPPDSPQDQLFWSNLAEHHQKALGDALDANNQLCLTLNKKQEETRVLQQQNLHLKELANQAKHLASVLSRLIGPSGTPPPPGAPPALHSPTKRRRLEGRSEAGSGTEAGAEGDGEGVPAGEEVRQILRDVSERCRAVLQERAGGGLPRPRMHGAFQGLLTSTPQSRQRRRADEEEEEGEEEEESTAFRTSIRDHCTIRTLAFPQGHAFTSRTPQGGCRFRWIPS
ncbi:multicilin-like isoform X1 [Anguilla rostrata]|uniref:multicilin-like isoform X1 n=2 Tax=Anguilla rostrata TaxID=7938 RepID=UPI0030CCABCA